MTAHELADALDAAVAHISPTVDETHPMTGVYVSVRHDTLRRAAHRLRELEAVRVAAENAVEIGHHEDCEMFRGDDECECGHDELCAALRAVGCRA